MCKYKLLPVQQIGCLPTFRNNDSDIEYLQNVSRTLIYNNARGLFDDWYCKVVKSLPDFRSAKIQEYIDKCFECIDELNPSYRFLYLAYIRKNDEDYYQSCQYILDECKQDKKKAILIIVNNMVSYVLIDWLNELNERLSNNNIKNSDQKKPTAAAYAIMHVLLEKAGGQGITKTNAEKLSKNYAYKPLTLSREFEKYRQSENFDTFQHSSKKSCSAQLSNMENALTLLQNCNSPEFIKHKAKSIGEKILSDLKKIYRNKGFE